MSGVRGVRLRGARIIRWAGNLLLRPDRLARIAAPAPPLVAVVVGLLSWPLVLTLAAVGGGVGEPYSSFGEYFEDTLRFAPAMLVITGPVVIVLVLWVCSAAGRSIEDGAIARAVLLSGAPMLGALLMRLPFQVVARADGQVFPRPAFPRFVLFVGADGWLLVLLVLWVLLVGKAIRDLGRERDRLNEGLCPACGYDRRGLRVCPECGS